MSHPDNHLIAALSDTDRDRLLACSDVVPLALAQVLCERSVPTRHVYFPTEGFISLVTRIDGDPGLEVGMVGREGMLGIQLALGVETTPWSALVQGPGTAWRIEASAFLREARRSAVLRHTLNRYLYVLMSQLAMSSACQRFHRIGPRLARWLLMSQDRAGTDRFHVTQEFLACMLGVRRVGITSAATALQRHGLIHYRRGELTVLDRAGLEAVACGCYAAGEHVYADVL